MNNNKNLTINEVFSQAVKNHQEGKTDIALKLYNQVLKIEPNHSQSLNNLGVIFQNQMNHEKAKDCYLNDFELQDRKLLLQSNLFHLS